MTTVHSTPELEAEASKGNRKYWQGFVLTDGNDWFTQTAFWQETSGGLSARQLSAPTRIGGKNIGRANETTPEQQARLEMDATEKKQREKGYHEAGQVVESLMLPMLAHKWAERRHSVSFPLYAQPKLDGCRCLMQGGRMWSRLGKEFIPAVVQHLLFDTGNVILDGELMLPHREYSFQDTMSAIKRLRPESAMLEYHVYDAYVPDNPTLGFTERYGTMIRVFTGAPMGVFPVQTQCVVDDDEIAHWHAHFTHPDQGFEGTILRTPGGQYTPGHRSVNLLKHKDFLDAEFEVVSVGEGRGKFEGVIMFTCVTPDGRTFDCGLRGSMDDRKEMFSHATDYVGRQLTVRYQNLTEDGIPRFPVGVAVREPEQG